MSWRIFRKKKTDDIRTCCKICDKKFELGDKILEFYYHGYRDSCLNRFHAKCMIEKLNITKIR